jgi:predicted enzyme related to lactoylglutathione lyase
MTTALDVVTLNTPDTLRLGEFWCGLLSLTVVENEDDGRWLVLATALGRRTLGLQYGATRAGSIHLDLACAVDDFDTELERAQRLGAQLLHPVRREPYGLIANLADPDGNLFDLCAYVARDHEDAT